MASGRYYETSLDRAGLALGVGALLGGGATVLLVVLGGQQSPAVLISAALLGTLFSALGLTAVGGPLWLLLHFSGRRGPRTAWTGGMVLGFLLLLAGQTYGYGLADMPTTDMRTLLFRWGSAAATSLLFALLSGVVALVMWRVAYRRA